MKKQLMCITDLFEQYFLSVMSLIDRGFQSLVHYLNEATQELELFRESAATAQFNRNNQRSNSSINSTAADKLIREAEKENEQLRHEINRWMRLNLS